MPGLDNSGCLDLSAIKYKDGSGEHCSAPEATVDSVLINVEPAPLALRHGTSPLGALLLRSARLSRTRQSIPHGLAPAGHQEPIGRRVCA